jgi:L-ribulose-5-phosphate 4-epimerase
MDNVELRKQLIEAAVRIERRNMQTNNGGNFSARCGDQMLIKPTDVSFITAVAEELVYADHKGRAVDPGPKPSKEAILHGLLYSNFEEVGAIMHCHSPWATTWAESMQPLDYST